MDELVGRLLFLWAIPGAAAGLLTALLRWRGTVTLLVNTVLGGIGGLGGSVALAMLGQGLASGGRPLALVAFLLASVIGGLLLIWILRRLFGVVPAAT